MRMRVPSPSTVLSAGALFVALGGTGYAAGQIAKNAVGANQIKTNAVGASEIKAGAVQASEVKNNALGGDDINESKLGTVPSAATAVTAGSAQTAAKAGEADKAASAATAANADNAANAAKLNGKTDADFVPAGAVQRVFHKLAGGDKKVLFTQGSLTLEAECIDNGTYNGSPNRDVVVIRIATSKNGATFVSDTDTLDGGAAPTDFLNTDTAADDREMYSFNLANGVSEQSDEIDSFSGIDPDGKAFTSGGGEAILAGVNIHGAACVVGGTFFPLN